MCAKEDDKKYNRVVKKYQQELFEDKKMPSSYAQLTRVVPNFWSESRLSGNFRAHFMIWNELNEQKWGFSINTLFPDVQLQMVWSFVSYCHKWNRSGTTVLSDPQSREHKHLIHTIMARIDLPGSGGCWQYNTHLALTKGQAERSRTASSCQIYEVKSAQLLEIVTGSER